MSGINGKGPEVSLSGPSVMALAMKRAGVLEADPLQPAPDSVEPKPIARDCHAVGCGAHTEAGCLFCKPHWLSLPLPTRRRMMFYVTRGQWSDSRKCRPEWLKEARQAIEIILRSELQHLTGRVFHNLPEGYDAALLRIERIGISTLAIHQEGKPLLVGSLATGEVREVKKPEPPAAANDNQDPGDSQPPEPAPA